MPRITVIITTFNRQKYLGSAIDSVLVQSFTDFELIILDNDSKDGTDAIVCGYTDARIRYTKHQPMGIAAQRNLGLNLSQGEFISFLDDDDIWLPSKLNLQYKKFLCSDESVGLVYGGFVFYDDSGHEWGTHKPKLTGQVLEDLLWARDPFSGSASNPMLRKAAVLSLGGYDEKILVGEDWELYLRLAERNHIEAVPETVLKIRQHTGPRLGQRVDAALRTERHVYVRFGRGMSCDLKSRYLQKIGGKYIRLGNKHRGRKYLRLAIRVYRTNAYAYVQLLLSMFNKKTYQYFHRLYINHLRE